MKGIEPSYSAWKSANFRNVFKSRSDILQLSGRLRSLRNFSLSEWRRAPCTSFSSHLTAARSLLHVFLKIDLASDSRSRAFRLTWISPGYVSTASKPGPGSRRRVFRRLLAPMEIREVLGATPLSATRHFHQHTGTHHKQGQDTLPKHLDAGDVIRIWHLCTRFVRATKTS